MLSPDLKVTGLVPQGSFLDPRHGVALHYVHSLLITLTQTQSIATTLAKAQAEATVSCISQSSVAHCESEHRAHAEF